MFDNRAQQINASPPPPPSAHMDWQDVDVPMRTSGFLTHPSTKVSLQKLCSTVEAESQQSYNPGGICDRYSQFCSSDQSAVVLSGEKLVGKKPFFATPEPVVHTELLVLKGFRPIRGRNDE